MKKSFTIGEELILPAAKNICCGLLGKGAVQKEACALLLAGIILRWIDELAEVTEAQLLERINESPWYASQVDKSTSVDNKAIIFVFIQYIFRRMCTSICYVHFWCQPTPRLQNYSSLNDCCCCFNSQSRLTLCDPMDCSTPGFSIPHILLEFTQVHVHWLSNAIQPSHPLLPPSPPALNLSQHQALF